LHLRDQLLFQLDDFSWWGTPGVARLFETLLSWSHDSGQENHSHDFLLRPLSRFVDATGLGVELLWRCMTLKVDDKPTYPPWNGLQCSQHYFHREDFLPDLLMSSDRFLDMVIDFIDADSEQQAKWYGATGVHSGLLHHTSWKHSHSRHDHYLFDDAEQLMDAVSKAIQARARDRAPWWRDNEARLRRHADLGIRYLFLLAYNHDLDGNINGISDQLLDPALHAHGSLKFELAELTRKVYPLLALEVQTEHQKLLLGLYLPPDHNPNAPWCIESVYQSLLAIPAPLRGEATQAYLDRWRPRS